MKFKTQCLIFLVFFQEFLEFPLIYFPMIFLVYGDKRAKGTRAETIYTFKSKLVVICRATGFDLQFSFHRVEDLRCTVYMTGGSHAHTDVMFSHRLKPEGIIKSRKGIEFCQRDLKFAGYFLKCFLRKIPVSFIDVLHEPDNRALLGFKIFNYLVEFFFVLNQLLFATSGLS